MLVDNQGTLLLTRPCNCSDILAALIFFASSSLTRFCRINSCDHGHGLYSAAEPISPKTVHTSLMVLDDPTVVHPSVVISDISLVRRFAETITTILRVFNSSPRRRRSLLYTGLNFFSESAFSWQGWSTPKVSSKEIILDAAVSLKCSSTLAYIQSSTCIGKVGGFLDLIPKHSGVEGIS
jgi:hypothetical protein